VVVVGGGLAGITAALCCADAGAAVTLVDVRPRLGGAAYSFERDGLTIDNGQHVFLRCFHAYRALLGRLGSEPLVRCQERLEIPVLSPDGRVTVLRRDRGRPPLHMARALLGYTRLGVRARLSAARAAMALRRVDTRSAACDQRSLGEWLAAHGQHVRAQELLWDLIALPSLNLPAREASLALGAFVFQHGLFESADSGDMGFHERPLGEVLGAPAQRALADAGVEVRLGWRAEGIDTTATGLEVRGGGGGLSAEAVVLAVQHSRAAELLPAPAEAIAARARLLQGAPIVNVHVVYDRPVCELEFAAGVETPVQYLFDRTEAAGAPAGTQYLAISLSGAANEMGMSTGQLRSRYVAALGELLPRSREAKLERFLVTREHAATFRASPGSAALRAGARSPVHGLAIAGAWTDTGWPATLESAVLSGHAAAAHALAAIEGGRGRELAA
jgi:squalene-associated FAD-dependent desaturase